VGCNFAFWLMTKFSPEQAPNGVPPWPPCCLPRSRRNASKADACLVHVRHAQSTPAIAAACPLRVRTLPSPAWMWRVPGHSPRSIPRFPSPFTPSSLSGARSHRARPHPPLLASRAHGRPALAALRAASPPQTRVVGPYRLLPIESRLPICAAAPPP
jgi:hypothetical protein